MRSKVLFKLSVIVIVLFVVAAVLFYFISKRAASGSARSMEATTVLPEPEQVSIGLPVRLIIPAIAVDAAVQFVGLTADGAMDVPSNQDDVGWYQLGPRPGENGSAVIAGHFGTWKKNGRGSVFDQLHLLQPGDQISVEDDQGVRTVFVVRESRSYDPDADAADVFTSADSTVHLNLITCEGEWNATTNSYSKRLVIFADKE